MNSLYRHAALILLAAVLVAPSADAEDPGREFNASAVVKDYDGADGRIEKIQKLR